MQELEVELAKARFARRHVSKMAGIGLAALVAKLTMVKPAQADADGDNDDDDNDEGRQCFLKGTRIETVAGERNVEDLAVGDLLPTRFNGLQPIQWIGRYRYRRGDASRPWVRTCFPFASPVRPSPLTCRTRIYTCLGSMPSLSTACWCALAA